jgi:glucokinase
MGIFVTVDVGGTQIRVASFSRDSIQPIQVKRIPTRSSDGTAYDRLVGLIESVWPVDGKVDSITVATPGPTDPETGVVAYAPNVPGWENYPLGSKLNGQFNVPAHIGNDANLAALGEWKFGAGKGHKHVLYLTISTGIGAGVISDNHLLLGRHGLAIELGHVTVLPDGPLCGCGQHGHLEAVASGPSIARYVNEQLAGGRTSILKAGPGLSAREVDEAAQNGDALAIEALARAGAFIGQALADFLHIFNPSIVIFGGGVSFSGPLLFDPMRDSLKEHVMTPAYLKDLSITTAKLGDDVGLLGALALAHTLQDN